MDRGRGGAAKADRLPTHALKTIYLGREGEPNLHLVNDPFDYDKYKL